jgi:hypothetical protein
MIYFQYSLYIIKLFMSFLLKLILYTVLDKTRVFLKVPKCEIFDRSDFHDFYTKKSLWVNFVVKIC